METVEAENLREFTVPPRIPSGILGAILCGCQCRRKKTLLLDESQEVVIPNAFAIVFFERTFALRLKKLDGLQHDFAGAFIRIRTGVVMGIEKNHRGLLGWG